MGGFEVEAFSGGIVEAVDVIFEGYGIEALEVGFAWQGASQSSD